MDAYLEIAVPLQTKAVTFFVGTGFSKYLTNGEAPSWQELLVELSKIGEGRRRNVLKGKLFEINKSGRIVKANFELSICAQMIELEYIKQGKDFKEAVAEVIRGKINNSSINNNRVGRIKAFFKNYPEINFVTTNYDTLLSDYVLKSLNRNPRIIVDGSPIPKSNIGQNIYHIHGCITRPSSIVITINDYFKFQHRDSYFSRKLSTLLHENTVVIIGYSLGDFNLNRIFNEAQISKAVSLRRNEIYLVSRNSVDNLYKEFYSNSYGINVIDYTEIAEFIDQLDEKANEARELVAELKYLNRVLDGSYTYTDDFIKLESAFSQIIVQAYTNGISSSDKRLINVLLNITRKKKEFTKEPGAWSQYAHLADWLIELATIVDISNSEIKSEYLKLVKYSFSTMNKDNMPGYSWAAYRAWERRFQEIKIENQEMIRKYIKQYMPNDADAMSVISRE